MNLLENKYNLNSYYCTWTSQAAISRLLKLSKGDFFDTARDCLKEETVFGENGLIHQFPEIRDKLIFLFDDGWDVPYGLVNNNNGDFGSIIVNEERFPSCTGEPKEKMKKLADKVREFGWKGVGLWICASAKGEAWENMLSHEERVEYWSERLEWSKYAGISYWKVDWGSLCNDVNFRKLLNELKDKVYPELVIEHAVCIGPLTDVDGENYTGRFENWGDIPKMMVALSEFSDVIRTYDVSGELQVPTTIDRVQCLLRGGNALNSKSHINAEDVSYICAALSVQIGIMRSQLKQDGVLIYKKTTESIRAVNWLSSFAPPLEIGEGTTNVSDEVLNDICDFSKVDSWVSKRVNGRKIQQGAPAIVTRNDELTDVDYLEESKPYVVSTRHPNGAYAVAVLPRLSIENKFFTPAVKLNISQNVDFPIGIFGETKEVNSNYDSSVENKKVFAQDLASDEAVDITDKCVICGSTVKIDGELLNEIGTSKNPDGDVSSPGLVIKLV